jgi:hypothetical protein
MSVNAFTQPAKGFGGEPRYASLSFCPNGTDNPSSASNEGPPGLKATAITYSATGVYTLVFPTDFAFPADTRFVVSAQPADLTGWFEVTTLGDYSASTRTLVVQAHRAGTGEAVAAAAGARIHVGIFFNDSQGG